MVFYKEHQVRGGFEEKGSISVVEKSKEEIHLMFGRNLFSGSRKKLVSREIWLCFDSCLCGLW